MPRKPRQLLNSAVVAVSLLPLIASAHAEEVSKDIITSAKADYMTYCAVCHGRDGTGGGPVAQYLTSKPADLTMLAQQSGGTFPEQRMHIVIDGRQEVKGHGTRDMPIWGNWFSFIARAKDPQGTDSETSEIIVTLRIQGVIDYLKTIQQK